MEYVGDTLRNTHTERDVRYDRNGNILSMTRTNGADSENISFTYDGNRRTNDGFSYRQTGERTLIGVSYGGGMILSGDDGLYSTVVYLRNHLGSTRTKVKDRKTIIGEYDYLPYGELASYSTVGYANDFLFGSKEYEIGQDILWYDSGACYQTTHSVFTSQDPLAEQYYSISPYAYCTGNPIFFVDDSGNDLVIVGKGNSSVTFKTDLVNMSVNISRLGVDWKGNYSFEGNELLGAALDIAGVFDPTGVADAANASLQLSEGKYGDAFVSALGLIPYVGDVAKVTRVGKDLRIINDAVEGITNTKSLRKNLTRMTGLVPKDMQAHHIFPKKFRWFFEKHDINIDDPHFGTWLETHKHPSGANSYNNEWEAFIILKPNATKEEILNYSEKLMNKVYGQ